MSQPLVSVIIATRNRASVLERCLDEYAKQTYPRLELIVVDNGSTDETWSVLCARADVTAIRLAENRQAQALNKAIDVARGTYIWRTDDDAYPANHSTIEMAVRHLESHPMTAVVSGIAININEGNVVIGEHQRSHELRTPDGYLEHSSFMGCTALLRRDVVVEAGGFWTEFYNEEQDLSLRILSLGWNIHWMPSLVSLHLGVFSLSSKEALDNRWRLRVITRARLLAVYFPRMVSLVRISLELVVEVLAAMVKRVSPRVIMVALRDSFGQWRNAGKHRRLILPRSTRRFVVQHTMGLHETLRYYTFRFRARTKGTA